MNILIIDQPLYNRGDESAYKGVVKSMLKYMPNANIRILEINTKEEDLIPFNLDNPKVSFVHLRNLKVFLRCAYRYYHLPYRILIRLTSAWSKIIKIYQWADVVVVAPGGFNLGGFKDWRHLVLMLMSQRTNKPLCYFARSIGPFPTNTHEESLFKHYAGLMLKYCIFVSLRDKKSTIYAKELGVDYYSTVDSAFLDSPKVEIPKEIKDVINKKPYVVFIPNELIWHPAYKNRIKAEKIDAFYLFVIESLVSYYPNANIVMLPQTYNQRRNDYQYFIELVSKSQFSDKIIVVRDIYSSDIQQCIISQSLLVVGGRYHSIVFSINQYRPFISLSYEHKMVGLLEILGVQDRIIDITRAFDDEEAIKDTEKKFLNILQSPFTKEKEIGDKAKKISKEVFMKFVNAVNGIAY